MTGKRYIVDPTTGEVVEKAKASRNYNAPIIHSSMFPAEVRGNVDMQTGAVLGSKKDYKARLKELGWDHLQ